MIDQVKVLATDEKLHLGPRVDFISWHIIVSLPARLPTCMCKPLGVLPPPIPSDSFISCCLRPKMEVESYTRKIEMCQGR